MTGSSVPSVTPDAAAPASAPEAERLYRLLAVVIALLAVVARLWVSWRTHSLGEDALITLRYAENIAAGRGYVYNPGEHVLGTTCPLYTLILALAACLHLPAMASGILLNILADSLTCYLLARLLARPEIGQPVAGLFAALLYALSSTPISVSIGGMEAGLVACAGLAAITAYIAGKSRPLYILGALLFLLRIDGILLFILLALGLAVRQRRIPWQDVGLFILLILPWLVFAAFYFGSPIPASLTAKLTVYTHTAATPGCFTNTFAFNHEAFASQFMRGETQRYMTFLFVMGVTNILIEGIRSIFHSSKRNGANPSAKSLHPGWPLLIVPLIWLFLYYGTMLTSRVPAFPWYFLPPWALFVGTAAIGAAALCELLVRMLALKPWPIFWQAALAVFGLGLLVHLRSIAADVGAAQATEDRLRRPLGIWLRDHVGPNERVLMEPIGYAGYFSQKRILDMVGLVSPEVLPYYHTPHALSGIVNGFRPEWLCLRVSERDLLHEQDPALPGSQYTFIQSFPSEPDPAFVIYHRRSSGQ